MLIAVISDSHGNRISIDKVKKRISSADVLLFLGDGEDDLREITEEFKGEYMLLEETVIWEDYIQKKG